jgi:rhodanese-related sulfurtransferase
VATVEAHHTTAEQEGTAMRTIDREELRTLLEDSRQVAVVLTLGPEAHRAAHIPGSTAFADLDEALGALDPEEPVIVYCTGEACPSSIRTYRLLEQHGFTGVRRYAGGLTDWDAAGYPLAGSGRLGATA